ncbi:MAG: ATP synthase subunit I [Methylophilaceae bacterium]|nr:ATP synthase subunit I [Methylophilaceae bacterium]
MPSSQKKISSTLSTEVLVIQIVLIAIIAVATYLMSGYNALSVAWGGLCSLVNVGLLKLRLHTDSDSSISASRHLGLMYRSALERFFVVMGLLAFGVLRMDLVPFAVLLGFMSGQVGLILAYLIFGMREKAE